jgi:hypothetical protein
MIFMMTAQTPYLIKVMNASVSNNGERLFTIHNPRTIVKKRDAVGLSGTNGQ